MVNISLFTRIYRSQVVQDFFYQPYHQNKPLILIQPQDRLSDEDQALERGDVF